MKRRGPQKKLAAKLCFCMALMSLALCLPLQNAKARAIAPKKDVKKQQQQQRKQLINKLQKHQQQARKRAKDKADQMGIPLRRQHNGTTTEIVDYKDGRFYTYTTLNDDAAISSGADLIRDYAPYLDGSPLTVGVWDGGSVRTTHQEFGSRASKMDSETSIQNHATHVAGTIAAAGINTIAKGMAPAINLLSYDWISDYSELASEGATASGQTDKIYISNHSYGYIAGWRYDSSSGYKWYGDPAYRESDIFGQYNLETSQWDDVCFNAPYLLVFKAAGNDRNDNAPSNGTSYLINGTIPATYNSGNGPYDDGYDLGGYDTITWVGNAKNIMTIGAVGDAVNGAIRDASNADMTAYSGWGPTDDGRVKPDIVADGGLGTSDSTRLYSAFAGSDSSYGYMHGTSMACPSAAGSAALLVDLAQRCGGNYLTAASIKALIINTADDLGNPGPDYQNGWGLMNVDAAADILIADCNSLSGDMVIESQLNSTNTEDTYLVNSDGTAIRLTLCWTDPAGPERTAIDDPTSVLINDLDIKIIEPDGQTIHYPYFLNVAAPSAYAQRGDNIIDNVEQVYIPATVPGIHTVVIDHKDGLTNNYQDYSLVSNVYTQKASVAEVDQFDFSYITSPQDVNDLMEITITAKDINGDVVMDFNDSVQLTGWQYNTQDPENPYPIEIWTGYEDGQGNTFSGQFTAGIWTGDIIIPQEVQDIFLIAEFAGLAKSSSNLFDVMCNESFAISTPFPINNAYDVPLDTLLTWQVQTDTQCSNGYDIYFSSQLPFTDPVAENYNDTIFDPNDIEYWADPNNNDPNHTTTQEEYDNLICGTTYYWQIVAKGCCTSIPGPVWSFRTAPAGDTDGNCQVNIPDFNEISLYWDMNCSAPDWCSEADINRSGTVDITDLAVIAEKWLTGL